MDDPVPTSPSSHPLLDRPAWQTMYDGSLSTLLGEHLARLFRMALGKYKNTNDNPYSIIFIRGGDWRGHPDPPNKKTFKEQFNNTASFLNDNINCYPLESLYNVIDDYDDVTLSIVNGEIVGKIIDKK